MKNIKNIIIGILIFIIVLNGFIISSLNESKKSAESLLSYIVICDENDDTYLYNFGSKKSYPWKIKKEQDMNSLMGTVESVFDKSVIIRANSREQYRVEIKDGDDSIKEGDTLLVFYSKTRPQLQSPGEFEKQYGYINITDAREPEE